jgi:hypothetical protein
MAATEVKVPTTAAYSDGTLSVVAGETIAIFTDDAAGLAGNEAVSFYLDTPDADLLVFTLNGKNPAIVAGGTMDLIGKKAVTTVAVGIAKYTPA